MKEVKEKHKWFPYSGTTEIARCSECGRGWFRKYEKEPEDNCKNNNNKD